MPCSACEAAQQLGNPELTQHLLHNTSTTPRILQLKGRQNQSHHPGSSGDPPPGVVPNDSPIFALHEMQNQLAGHVHVPAPVPAGPEGEGGTDSSGPEERPKRPKKKLGWSNTKY